MKRLLTRRSLVTLWLLAIGAEAVALAPTWAVATTTIAGHSKIEVSGFAALPALASLVGVQALLLLLTLWLSKVPRAITLGFGSALTAVVLASSFGQIAEANFAALYTSIEQLSGEVSTPLAPGTAVTTVSVTSAPAASMAIGALLLLVQLLTLVAQFGWSSRASRYDRATTRAESKKSSDDPIDIWDSQR